jgi:hypothetical protein
MQSQIELADKIIDYLNELLELDPDAINAFCFRYIPCNTNLTNHPSVQVYSQGGIDGVALIGILNGLCGADSRGQGLIAYEFEEGTYEKMPVLIRFLRNPNCSIE